MAGKIIKFLCYPLFDLVYLLSIFIPRDKNKWIFGAWFGQKYADNSKYLFEYVLKNHPEIKAIWIAKHKRLVSQLNNAGCRSYYHLSFKGLYHIFTAKVAVLSTDKDDIGRPLLSPRHLKVQLWHGVGYKKIMYDDRVFGDLHKTSTRVKFFFFPFLKPAYDMVISTSKETQRQFRGAFRLPPEKVPITGYPRNDIFFAEKNPSKKTQSKILYAPTHRRAGIGMHIKEILPNPGEFEQLNEFVKRRNALLYFRLHYFDAQYLPSLEKYSNILMSEDDDIQEVLLATDILITDYSSIYFDYLLLDRPVIFTPFDLDDYVKNDREFHFRYEEVTPGPIAKNWPEVMRCIEEEMNHPGQHRKERENIRGLFYQDVDGNSSKRVVEAIRRVL